MTLPEGGLFLHYSSSVKKLTRDELRENTSLEEGKYLLEQKGMGLRKFPPNAISLRISYCVFLN